jgi:prophage DNA circulation protein
MTTADNNIIAALPELKWRGLRTPPYDLVTFEFENELASRSVAYLDGEIHDDTGRRSFPMTARLYFVNTLGEQTRLFPELWEEWKANLDGAAGELVHPVLGPLRARVKGAKGEVRSTLRSGVIVDITWIETIEDPAIGDFLGVLEADPATLAAATDAAGAAFGITYTAYAPVRPSGATIPTVGTAPPTSLLQAYNQIKGSIFSAKLTINGALAQLVGTVEAMADAAEGLNDPTAWPLVDTLFQLWTALRDQMTRLARAARATAAVVLANDTTLDAFATRVGNTLNEVMGLNLQALRLPSVRRGATLRYYK